MEAIPQVTMELWSPVSALTRSAARLREAFLSLAEGHPLEDVLDSYGDDLELANRVVDAWIRHLELDEPLDPFIDRSQPMLN